jgi:S1-C subfamily serine protease
MTAAPDLDPLRQFSAALSGLVAAATPSIVSVRSHCAQSSGFVWKPGLVVTADEALAEEGEVAVVFAGGRREAASVAGRDPTTDVALLRVDTGAAPPLALEGAAPDAGSIALAVGAHDGRPVAAFGVTAASGPAWRSMRGGHIDARIELDLSPLRQAEGGVALGADGQAFGMAVIGPRRRVLVIPGATIARVAAQLEAHGKVARGYLGLSLQPVKLAGDGGMGAMVMGVDADGPGAKAGIHQGDVIAAWNGQPIASVAAMLRALGPASVGTTVGLDLRRGGESLTVEIVVGERP